MDIDYKTLPFIQIPGSEDWISAYYYGEELEERFPGQECYDLTSGCEHNGFSDRIPLITNVVCIQVGENDARNWIWHVGLNDGSLWTVEGGCDYTGWDCQSDMQWRDFYSV